MNHPNHRIITCYPRPNIKAPSLKEASPTSAQIRFAGQEPRILHGSSDAITARARNFQTKCAYGQVSIRGRPWTRRLFSCHHLPSPNSNFKCHHRLPSLFAITACHHCLQLLSGTTTCHHCLPSPPAITACHHGLSLLPAINGFKRWPSPDESYAERRHVDCSRELFYTVMCAISKNW